MSRGIFLDICFSHTPHTPTGSWFVRNREGRTSGQVTERLQSLEEGWEAEPAWAATSSLQLASPHPRQPLLSPAWTGLCTALCPSLPQAVFPWALNPQALFCILWSCCASLFLTPCKVHHSDGERQGV